MVKILKDRRLWVVTIVAFALLLIFFDRNNMLERSRLKSRIDELERQCDYFRARIEEDSVLLERLKDDEYLEKYARENYLMKRDGETVYIISE